MTQICGVLVATVMSLLTAFVVLRVSKLESGAKVFVAVAETAPLGHPNGVRTVVRRPDRSGCHTGCGWSTKSCTVCKSLKVLVRQGGWREFNLRFPPASTGKFQRPQLLHKDERFLCCGERRSDGEWVQRNVRVPDSAG